MTQKRISLTLTAQRNLQDIWFFIARDNVGAADALLEDIYERFSLLSRFEKAGRQHPRLREGVRTFPCGSYVIYYRIMKDSLQILRIRHAARRPLGE